MADHGTPALSCVTVFLNAARFLQAAIDSVVGQTFEGWELVLVDDGSSDGSTDIARAAAAARPGQIRYLEHNGHANLGESASRNLGVDAARGEFLTFLDADDVLLPAAFQEEVGVITAQPDVAMAYGRFERWYSWTGRPQDQRRDAMSDPGVAVDTRHDPPDLLLAWLRNESAVPANCSTILRRAIVQQVGGFEEAFSRISGDDLVLYTKIIVGHAAFVAGNTWSRYRQHPAMSVARSEGSGQWHPTRPNLVRESYLNWLDGFLTRQGVEYVDLRRELNRQLLPYRHAARYRVQHAATLVAAPARRRLRWLRRRLRGSSTGTLTADPNPIREIDDLGRGRTTLSWTSRATNATEIHVGMPDGPLFSRSGGSGSTTTDDWVVDGTTFYLQDVSDGRRLSAAHTLDSVRVAVVVPEPPRERGPQGNDGTSAPAVGRVQFGDLARPTPISRDWGYERGTSVARWYIERFVAARAPDIRGRVLEIGDDAYTRRFGGDRVERSDVLNVNPDVPGTTIVADLADAPQLPSSAFDCILCIQTLQLIFEVGSAIRTLHRALRPGGVLLVTLPGVAPTAGTWRQTTYWKFTPLSAQRLFADVFGRDNVAVSGSGNALAAVAHLHGLAVQDLAPGALDRIEDGYEVSIAVRAVKSTSDDD